MIVWYCDLGYCPYCDCDDWGLTCEECPHWFKDDVEDSEEDDPEKFFV